MPQRIIYLALSALVLTMATGCRPTARFLVEPDEGRAPLTVQFTDTSATTIPFLGNVNVLVPIQSWEWDFGDGFTSQIPNPEHTYTEQGAYTVSLTVTNRAGASTERKENFVRVIGGAAAPQATFTAAPRTGVAPLTVQFTDTTQAGEGVILRRRWNFGDASPVSEEQNPSHAYTRPGTYAVTLTLDTTGGTSTTTREGYIVVAEAPRAPQANFTEDTTQGIAPLTVRFTDLSSPGDAAITAWEWQFGDGGVSLEANPTHTYEAAGTYNVVLTVRTSLGSSTRRKDSLVRVLAPAK